MNNIILFLLLSITHSLHPDQPPQSPAAPPITGYHGPRQPEPVPPPHLGGAPAMEPTSPPIAGLYGQDCTPASGDFPDKCPKVGDVLTSTNGKIECMHNHDCCICGQMICSPNCKQVNCNGDSSCFGVKYIMIEGDPVSGARLDCNGDVSCMSTNIRGTNMNIMGCTGDFSCAYSRFYLEGIASGAMLACVGDDSCKGHPTNPNERAYFDVVNSFGMYCSHDSCRDATFNLINNVGGAVVCGAEASCTNSVISADNIESVLCGGEFACYESSYLITNPKNGFSLSCAGFAACKGLHIEILVTNPDITNFRGVICNSFSACQGISVTINKVVRSGNPNLYIEELSCGASKSCKDASFDLGPNVHIEHCGCAGGLTLACDNVMGVNNCITGLKKLECVGALEPCRGMTETITNPLQDFELICNDANSCQNFDLTIIMDGTKPTSSFKGIKCGSPTSCTNMRITIVNYDTKNRLNAGDVHCGSPTACTNVVLDYYYADVGTIFCGDSSSCTGCTSSVDGVCTECFDRRSQCAVAGGPVFNPINVVG
eukprot:246490_1